MAACYEKVADGDTKRNEGLTLYDQETSSYVRSHRALGYHVAIHAAEGAQGNLLPLIDSGEVT